MKTYGNSSKYRVPLPADLYAIPMTELAAMLQSSPEGLSQSEADHRLTRFGRNEISSQTSFGWISILLNQLKNPIPAVLFIAALISISAGEWPDAIIVLSVITGSTILGFVQEYIADNAVNQLRSRLSIRTRVLRDHREVQIPVTAIVPGDVVRLSAGSLIPADGIVMETDDLFVSQASMTGEVFPVQKQPGTVAAQSSLAEQTNRVFMGTSVRNGSGSILITHTGETTVFGQIAGRLRLKKPETEFERGIRQFGILLTRTMLLMMPVVLAMNIVRDRPPVQSLLFALALVVGLAPELLPAIISITLSQGARRMAKSGVLIRRLNAIENLGCMDVLCTDKTGTLTEGIVRLHSACDLEGTSSTGLLQLAALNATLQSGLPNSLDDALAAEALRLKIPPGKFIKAEEIPYDFVRKRLSVVVEDSDSRTFQMITKGAFSSVLEVSTRMRTPSGPEPLTESARQSLRQKFEAWSQQGFRVLGLGTRELTVRSANYSKDEERDLCFEGFLLFHDPPKQDAARTVKDLADRGVDLRIITGDNPLVAAYLAKAIGMPSESLLTGRDLNSLSDEALWHLAEKTAVFAEVDPGQKERIIQALKSTGHVVGYMGDGINDSPALHAADVSISVENAADVARDAAEIVLLQPDLSILRDGIDEGRKTFANTQKYILTTSSANFGNMLSMAVASLFLPFLPLLASQILLNNFLSDIPGTTIAGDNVDPEWVRRPHKWDSRFLTRYMIVFGTVSSVFDLLTFAILLLVFRAGEAEFRTGWFMESLLTELVIALVVRTRRPFYRSRPGSLLLLSSLAIMAVTLMLPQIPLGSRFGFVPLPFSLWLAVAGLTILYVIVTELTKSAFYARFPQDLEIKVP